MTVYRVDLFGPRPWIYAGPNSAEGRFMAWLRRLGGRVIDGRIAVYAPVSLPHSSQICPYVLAVVCRGRPFVLATTLDTDHWPRQFAPAPFLEGSDHYWCPTQLGDRR